MNCLRASVVLALSICFGAVTFSVRGDDSLAPIDFEQSDSKIAIRSGGFPVADFVFRDADIPRPHFANLFAPGGVRVSRNHPPKEGQDATDHALMHPGLWLAFGDLSGADSWRLKAPIELVEFIESPEVVDGALRFVARFRHRSSADADAPAIAEELCRIHISRSPSGFWIEYDSTFSPLRDSLVFGDQEEMGLGVRLATELTVKGGGTIENASGQFNEKEVWGKTSPWCDYRGAIGDDAGGRIAGMLIAPHPKNFRPSWFHARDYGVLVANAFGRKAFEGGEPSQVVVKSGDSLRLRYAVLLHSTPKSTSGEKTSFDAAGEYARVVERWRE